MRKMPRINILNFTLLILLAPTLSTPLEDHFLNPSSRPKHFSSSKSQPQEYLELALPPPPSDHRPPSCTHPIIHHSFADTVNKPPFSTPYPPPPPNCPPPWDYVILDFRVGSRGDQYDRVAGLWLAGVELLRTTTAEPTPDGIFWKVRKDVTRYSSLFSLSNLNLTVKLENIVNDVFTGIYHVNVTLYFYKYEAVKLRTALSPPIGFSPYRKAADLVIPVSSPNGSEEGYWFVIQGTKDVRFKKIRFPQNTLRAVLELYVSFHGDDEFWYSNPPDSYIRANNLTTGRGGGSYREVYLTVDGVIVGSEVPFPVIFTGGINPLFWQPVVAIGAFDLPSYDFDLTPFLGMGLLDGGDHEIGVGVSESIPYWLVDANLQVWLDDSSPVLEGRTVISINPRTVVKRREKFRGLDGAFSVRAKRQSRTVGWVNSSILGNVTTSISHVFNLRNSVQFQNNGTLKTVIQKGRTVTTVQASNDVGEVISRVVIRRKYPLKVVIETVSLLGEEDGAYVMRSSISHAWEERVSSSSSSSGSSRRGMVSNRQESEGWMKVKDHDVLDGAAGTNQSLVVRDQDGFGCYVRAVSAVNGSLVSDNTTHSCPSLMQM